MSVEMGGEVSNLIVDLSIVLASLLYSHGVGKFFVQGTTRFLALFPVIYLFLCLPLNLQTVFFAGPTSFFISWLGSFKLVLYAFGRGPLSSHPPLPLSHFIATASLPIKILKNEETPSHQTTKKSHIDYAPRVLLFIFVTRAYGYKDYLPPLLTMSFLAYYFIFLLIQFLALLAFLVRTLLGVKLEPQFDEPHHATSVQNFWGKRWNLMVSDILRPAVYNPARAIFSHFVPERWVSVPAVLVTFLVSGIMHEFILYHLGQVTPTWEMTWFFIVHGLCVGTEIVIKKTTGQRFEQRPVVAWLLTLTFITFTSFWLFFPPFLRLDPCSRICREVMAFVGFLRHGHLLGPNEYSCPFT
ncbi:hypothetical protein L2E82_15349 [Cichorium intybus]|uniref:Uncharacterized protein n=1 Tax=Cichorium intybus TaxID=13427 RepID=A0ACB9F2K6_CICIN|nr:hypothetical protein L2E82_15349 [Cichorium intybus]